MAKEMGKLTKHVGGAPGEGVPRSSLALVKNSGVSLGAIGRERKGIHLVDYNY